MKITKLPGTRQGGFTLIELLVTMGIVAALAAMVIAGLQVARKSAAIRDTEARIGLLEAALTGYNTDNGEYPEPSDDEMMGNVSRGGKWNIGGAACLYQALLGDGNDMIKGYQLRANEQGGGSRGEVGGTGGTVYMKETAKGTLWERSGQQYILLDGFGHPWRYKRYDPKNPDETESKDAYDLWSYGPLKGPSDAASDRGKWIKNW